MTSAQFKEIEKSLPSDPGIYQYYDNEKVLLYVGKAKNLRKRISSYFNKSQGVSGKTRILVGKIKHIEYTVVDNEEDALHLENSLIKEWQPKYNILLKDDKSYPWICIKKERFPRVFMTRQIVNDGSEYLGPFTSVGIVRSMLEIIRDLYPLRTCNFFLSEKNINAKKFKVCLEYHLGNCLGPCENHQDEEEYNEYLVNIRKILNGQIREVIDQVKQRMNFHAEQYEFENAEEEKKILDNLIKYKSKSAVVSATENELDVFTFENYESKVFVNYMKVNHGAIVQNRTIELKNSLDLSDKELLLFAIMDTRNEFNSSSKEVITQIPIDLPIDKVKNTVPKIGDKKTLLELSRKNLIYYRIYKTSKLGKKVEPRSIRVLETLKKDLGMSVLPEHIECFDNSNFQGSFPVASMVVFKNGKPAKKDYRHYNIKEVVGIDDFASMEEIVYRRYKRLISEGQDLPQLILIDGGKGQLSAAVKSLETLGIADKVVVLGIAKRLEELYRKNDPIPLHIDKRSEGLKLMQQLRNEAHRFAITFHRLKRDKGTLKTDLTGIKGIGKQSSELLLKKFKSIKKIKIASSEELAKVIGPARAKLLISHFSKIQ